MNNKIKYFRSELGIPLDALAFLTGLSRWVIRAIEMGYREPTSSEMESLAKALGHPLCALFPERLQK